MKRHIKQIKYLIVFLLTCFSVTIQAATVYTNGYFKYTIQNKSIAIVEYFGSETEVTIPSSIVGYPVSVIEKGAFVDTPVKQLNLPDTIMEIKEGALQGDISVVYDSNTQQPIVSAPVEEEKQTETEQEIIYVGSTENVKDEAVTVVTRDIEALDVIGEEAETTEAISENTESLQTEKKVVSETILQSKEQSEDSTDKEKLLAETSVDETEENFSESLTETLDTSLLETETDTMTESETHMSESETKQTVESVEKTTSSNISTAPIAVVIVVGAILLVMFALKKKK